MLYIADYIVQVPGVDLCLIQTCYYIYYHDERCAI